MSAPPSVNGTAPPPLPVVPLPDPATLPPEMVAAPFITFRIEYARKKDGTWKLNKPPTIDGVRTIGADTNITCIHGALERAKRLREQFGPIVGVGISFWRPVDLWILDLDGELIGPELTPRLRWLCENAPTWGEVSVSGTGLHFVYRGAWRVNKTIPWRGHKAEIIGDGKYCAITGQHWPDSLSTLEDA